MSTAFPPGGTYFDGRKSFADVNYDAEKDNAINTTQFLEASESLTTLFDVIGGAAFKPVKSDMQGNIKVRKSPSPPISKRMRQDNQLTLLAFSENYRTPTRRSSRVRYPAKPRPQRAQDWQAHRIRRPSLARQVRHTKPPTPTTTPQTTPN
jgi:hypothetical protein